MPEPTPTPPVPTMVRAAPQPAAAAPEAAARPATTPSFGHVAAARAADPRWLQTHYVVQERRFTFGRQYRVLDDRGQLVAYCKQKVFRLREDIRFYTGEDQKVELFRLATAKIIDWNANFSVTDSATGQVLGHLRRKGWKSVLKDEWVVFDGQGQHLGNLHEEGGWKAAARRAGYVFGALGEVFGMFFPYKYHLMIGPEGTQREAGTIQERRQFFGDTYDLHRDVNAPVDGRVLIGLTVCVDAIEGE